MRVLLIEDERALSRAVCEGLAARGFTLELAETIADGQARLSAGQFDMLLLDQRLPDGSGLELLRRLRTDGKPLPVVVITARSDVPDRVAGLAAGADDYVPKPFDMDELAARMLAVLRRARIPSQQILQLGRIRYEPARQRLLIDDQPVELPPGELAILEMLLSSAGRVVLREQIEETVYGREDAAWRNALEAAISRLRRRLQRASAGVEIRPVRGLGYLLQAVEA